MNIASHKSKIIELRPLYGNASQFHFEEILPKSKCEKELFWSTAVIPKVFPDLTHLTCIFEICKDDSSGNPDVNLIIGDKTIGIQVTEFTNSLRRRNRSITIKLTEKIIEEIRNCGITGTQSTICEISFNCPLPANTDCINVKSVIKEIADFITSKQEKYAVSNSAYSMSLLCNTKPILVQNANNIGIQINYDRIPFDYMSLKIAIDDIWEKKEKSIAEWLLIWDTEFSKYEHIFGADILKYMKDKYQNSRFDKVIFSTAPNCTRRFHPNLKHELIRGDKIALNLE